MTQQDIDNYNNRIKLQEFNIKKQKSLYNEIYNFTINFNNIKWNERLYRFFNNNLKKSKCKYCNKETKFNNLTTGFNKFCSRNCINNYAKTDKIKKNKISKTLLKRNSKQYNLKYPLFKKNIEKENKNYLIKNFCIHGNLILSTYIFNKIYNKKLNNNNIFYCEKCNENFISNYILNKNDKLNNKEIIKTIDSTSLGQKIYIKRWFPKLYIQINELRINCTWTEKVYLIKNNLNKIPICSNNNCNNIVDFNFSMCKFNLFCNLHKNSSNKEIELQKFINNFYKIQKIRNKNYEIDIYIPDLKIGIEFNGIYWHSEKFKNKTYHYNKYLFFKNIDINIINIWEDDWILKKNLIKSILLNKIYLSPNKIYGRKCELKKIKDTKQFLNDNHLQGWCQSSINLGLYYENELVSLMTFGKRKISSKTQYELLRFCNKINYSVIGGASKLFKHFLNNYNNDNNTIYSYANLDISNGNLYEVLGFKKIGHTGINYWWVKDKKYNRTNFMKHKLVKEGFDKNKTETQIMRERGFYKIWGTGNLKYEFKL